MTLKEYLIEKDVKQNIDGYYYLLEAVDMLKNTPTMPKVKIGKVYETIAQKHNTNWQVIERNMRYCLKSCSIQQSVSRFLYAWANHEKELEQKNQKENSWDIYTINGLLTDCMIEIQDYNLKSYTIGDIFERLSAMFSERLEEYLCQS